MDFICPVCNGLQDIYMECPKCSGEMKEGGSLQQFFDPYSPYISGEILKDEGVSEKQCVHLAFCDQCGHDTQVTIQKESW